VPLAGVVDFSAELERVKKELGKVRERLSAVEKKLANAQFREKAPAEVVRGEEEKRDRLKAELEALQRHLRQVEEML
jgi:valyl-tRNA synthetase